MEQVPPHCRRQMRVDFLKCFQRSALVADHQGAKLFFLAHHSTLCRTRPACDRAIQKNRSFEILSRIGRGGQIQRQQASPKAAPINPQEKKNEIASDSADDSVAAGWHAPASSVWPASETED